MPSKRRVIDDDDDNNNNNGEEQYMVLENGNSANKRARTESEDDHIREQKRSKKKGKAKGKENYGEDAMEEDEGEVVDDIEINRLEDENQDELDQRFEEEHYDRIMASIKARSQRQGTVAAFGVIEKVELYQFMCHQRLTFSFGPQINFIIGHNGSGKSAVLSAITIGLGGKTASTGRGNGLKSFIREGQTHAEVSIQLKNQGEEAYRHEDYGDSIVITRRFSVDGASNWKIKSKEGRTISTKREELSRICDHMNIQVDNPLTVLTQDASRVFLAASNPKERYKLFMKGTLLLQLSDEYDITLENIQTTVKVLHQKRETMPDLRLAVEEATARYKEAEQLRQQKVKIDDLRKELAWAHVKYKENQLTEKLKEVANLESKLPKIQAEIDSEKTKLDAVTLEFTDLEKDFQAMENVDDLERRRAEIQGNIRTNKERLQELTADMRNMNTTLETLKNTIAEYDKQIEQETQRLQKSTQAKREQIQQVVAATQSEIASHQADLASIQDQKKELATNKATAEQEGRKIEAQKAELDKQIEYQLGMIKNLEKAEKDNLLPYGRNIKAVLEQIGKMRWYGQKPLGPLGAYVKAKDPDTWGDILRNQLGQILMAFAITDPRDRNELKKLLVQTGNNHVQIIISSSELFDYSEGEPPTNYLTVLRALEITNPLVLRILVNNANIETRVLAKTRREAQQMLERLPRGGQACSLDGFTVRVFPDGIYSVPLELRRSSDSSNLMLTGRDTANDIRRAQQQIASLKQQQDALLAPYNTLRTEFMECNKQLTILEESERRIANKLQKATANLKRLKQELEEDMPMDITGFLDAKKEAEEEKESILKQFEPVAKQKAEIDATQKQLLAAMKEVRKQIGEFEERKNRVKTELENAAERRVKAQASVRHYEIKLQEAQAKVEHARSLADLLQEEFVSWTAKASEYCARVENPRPVADVEKMLKSLQNALKEREKRQGSTLEELEEEMIKARNQFFAVRANLTSMTLLVKKLGKSLITRMRRWHDFRRYMALRTKIIFQYHLSQRGYFGKLLFIEEGLELKVQTDDQAATQGHKDKDPRSLSGGEKSFSTICLLLALWESIGCPIRCLDEFDVFMDAVNRRISMKMMIETASTSNQKQYILITPLEMSNLTWGNTVRVHKMSDPQRNQGVLAFDR